MSVFTVVMVHPDGDGWNRFLREHVDYLESLIKRGDLIASGPLKGTELRSGFLVMEAESREAVEALVAGDPFAREGLIKELTISEWDPVFGALQEFSSGQLPGGLGEGS